MQKVLIGIILAAMILTVPSIYDRIKVEEENKTVETIVPFKFVLDWMIKDPELDLETILSELQQAGVDSISVEPDTLSTLQKKGEITVISVPRMSELLIFNQMDPLRHPYDKEGVFIYSNQDSSFDELTKNVFEDTRAITVEGVDYTFVPGPPAEIQSVPFGFDSQAVETILDTGMEVVPRMQDSIEPDDTERMAQDLLELKQPGIEKVLFMGGAMPFSGEPEDLKKFSGLLSDAGYSLFSIEFTDITGFKTAAYTMDLDIIRLHSQTLTADNAADIADKFVRGAKERNIRAFFINPALPEYKDAQEAITNLNNEIENQLPSMFSRGSSELYDTIAVPLWQIAIGLIGAIAFLAWAAQSVFNNRKLTISAIALLSVLALAYLITDLTLILKVFALGLAVTTPVFAVLLKKKFESKFYLISSYFKAVGITLIGIWLIVVILNGNAFILGIDAFKGVKLVYILPIAFLVLFALWGNFEKFFKSNVIYWHLLVFAIVAGVAIFYVGRSGNTGTTIPFEMEFRMMLEEILYVRPRTKEFLIGLPIFVLALHIAKKHKAASYYLLIPAVIGFLSMVNTFTHFHIPLSISLLRTGYSVIFGLLIGLFLVFLYKWASQKIITEFNRRWQA